MNARITSNSRYQAKHTLTHYFRHVWEKAGLTWTSDHNAEIEGIVDSIVDAAVAEAKAGL